MPGLEMVLLDCVIRVGHRIPPARRRLTLAPGATATSPVSGSRFQPLTIDEEVEQPHAEETAILAANLVLPQADHDVDECPMVFSVSSEEI